MKRRKFIMLTGMGIAVATWGGVVRFLQSNRPDGIAAVQPTPQPPTQEVSQTEVFTLTAPPVPPTATAALAVSPTAQPKPRSVRYLFWDDFTDHRPDGTVHNSPAADGLTTRITAENTRARIEEGALKIEGMGGVSNSLEIAQKSGMASEVRFQVPSRTASGRLGIFSPTGEAILTVRRTDREGHGGVIEAPGRAFSALNLYSNSWYDAVMYCEGGKTAFAVNDGAGLELVLVGETPLPESAIAGYAAFDQNQGIKIDQWYAIDALPFPSVLVDQHTPAANFAADLGTNAAWVEVQVAHLQGHAGLRVRSIDPDSEYRVYLDGNHLFVDQVLNGVVSPLFQQPITYRPGAKLAVRTNELTMTVYYDNQLVGKSNVKIGAPDLVKGTRAGVYTTSEGNGFQNFVARPVRVETPAVLSEELIQARQVLCLGDSLTNADSAFGYQGVLRKSLGDGWVTVDAGVSGQTTWWMSLRLPLHLLRYQPEVVVAMGGTNDIHAGTAASAIIANLQTIYTTAKNSGARVAALTIPPLGGYAGWSTQKQSNLEAVNAWILGSARDVDYRIDTYSFLGDGETGALKAKYDGGDHVHLSGPGYSTISNLILNSVSW